GRRRQVRKERTVNHNPLPATMKARILKAAQKKVSPARGAVALDTVLFLLTGAAAMVNVFLAVGGVHLGPRSTSLLVSTLLGRGSIALASTWAALARGGSMLGRSVPWLAATTPAPPAAIAG